MDIVRFCVDTLKVEIYPDSRSAGEAAANAAADSMRSIAAGRETVGIVFATGASQLNTLEALVAQPSLPWSKVIGFHLDEYLGLDDNHPASFRRYLREQLTDRVPIREFREIDGSTCDPEAFCTEYAAALQLADPQICLLGIGENGHLAFNDPPLADFEDPLPMKTVVLEDKCREQQWAEGWFASPADVPVRALTITIPVLMRIPRLLLSVPGERKADIVRRTLFDPISTFCPATILRTHPDATLYLDWNSARELPFAQKLRMERDET